MARHIRKGDVVTILSGDDAGKTGKVLRVLPKHRRVVVEGINKARKHLKRTQQNQQGGIIDKEMPLDWSKVAPVVEGKATRVRFEARKDGSKVRVAVRGGQAIGQELRKASR